MESIEFLTEAALRSGEPGTKIAIKSAIEEILSLSASAAEKEARIAELEGGLKRIEKWFGEFPSTEATWPDGSPMSFAAAFGSNGERDYMRVIARTLLSTPTGAKERVERAVWEEAAKVVEDLIKEWIGGDGSNTENDAYMTAAAHLKLRANRLRKRAEGRE